MLVLAQSSDKSFRVYVHIELCVLQKRWYLRWQIHWSRQRGQGKRWQLLECGKTQPPGAESPPYRSLRSKHAKSFFLKLLSSITQGENEILYPASWHGTSVDKMLYCFANITQNLITECFWNNHASEKALRVFRYWLIYEINPRETWWLQFTMTYLRSSSVSSHLWLT